MSFLAWIIAGVVAIIVLAVLGGLWMAHPSERAIEDRRRELRRGYKMYGRRGLRGVKDLDPDA
jgi:L-asparagine transporter-like permease